MMALFKVSQKEKYFLCILFLFIVFSIYGKTIMFEFIQNWDDDEYVIKNIFIRDFSISSIKQIFTMTVAANYAPLHLLSYSLDFSLWGLRPGGYHLSNVVLHWINACLVYALITRLTENRTVSLVAGLLFAVHPLNVENIAWVSERKTLLATFFLLLSFINYLSFQKEGRILLYGVSLLFFLLSILSKTMAIAFPFVLAAYEFFLGQRKRVFLILPFLLIGIADSVAALMAHQGAGSITSDILAPEFLFGTVYPTMLPVYWKYLGLIIAPFGLSGYYDTDIYHSFLQPPVFLSLVFLLALFASILLKGGVRLKFWFFWFWLWLLPVSNIVPIPVYYADRYMYLPAIAVYVLAGYFFAPLTAAGQTLKRISYCSIFAITLFYGVIALNRTEVWRNDLVFWQDTAAKSPRQYKARLNLGYAYDMRGMYAAAEKEYAAAAAIQPTTEATSNLRMVRLKKNSLRPE